MLERILVNKRTIKQLQSCKVIIQNFLAGINRNNFNQLQISFSIVSSTSNYNSFHGYLAEKNP